MLFFGHRFLASERFYHIDDIDAIIHTPSNSLLYVHFSEKNLDIIEHMRNNGISFGVRCSSLTEVMYANALEASYIIVEEPLCVAAQKAADHYLFDAKIVVRIEEEKQIETMAEKGVDGVLFPEGVIKISG